MAIDHSLKTFLIGLDACNEAVTWASAYINKPWQQAWNECSRGDWLFWMADKLGIERRLIVKVAAGCARRAVISARSVLHHVPAGEQWPAIAIAFAQLAIEAAELWTDEPTVTHAAAAEAACHAAAESVPCLAAYADLYAVYAATYAVYAARAAGVTNITYAPVAVSHAAGAAVNAARAVGGTAVTICAAIVTEQTACADIVRSIITYGAMKCAIDRESRIYSVGY